MNASKAKKEASAPKINFRVSGLFHFINSLNEMRLLHGIFFAVNPFYKTGVLVCWSIGVLKKTTRTSDLHQYSITAVLHKRAFI
jgi:hypothetical protein